MAKKIILPVFAVIFASVSFSQKVSNISFQREGDQVVINYDLQGFSPEVKVKCSTNGGNTWDITAESIKGDVENIETGKNKKITWDVFADTSMLLSENIAFKVIAKEFIEMVHVKGGTFQMGCTDEQSDCGSDETPVHTVTVDDFYISKYEITNQQYAVFMNEIGAISDGSYNGTEYLDINKSDCQINYTEQEFVPEEGKENHPVIEVTWHGAKAFCEHYGGQLPTEAEWEFAARGGNSATATIYAGNDNIDDVAWYDDNSSSSQKIGTKSPNELGIYDMSGNVWEWCNDWYDSDYYKNSPQDNPQGPSSGSHRVLRGGSWFLPAERCRVARRYDYEPGFSNEYSGFRFSRTVD